MPVTCDDHCAKAGAVPVIPGRRNRKRFIRYDKNRYHDRHLIENALCRLKDFRRVAGTARGTAGYRTGCRGRTLEVSADMQRRMRHGRLRGMLQRPEQRVGAAADRLTGQEPGRAAIHAMDLRLR